MENLYQRSGRVSMELAVLEQLGNDIEAVFFVIGIAILAIELLRGLFERTLSWRGFTDMLTNVSTQIPFLFVEIVILTGAYGIYWVISESFVSWRFEITPMSIALAILAADFFYYWEHRIAHRMRVFWIHHAVHHSSRYMNITTAIRFGPFEGALSILVNLPMVFIGFPAELIIFGSLAVLAYQTWIHTELIGKLGPIEWIFNTPAHHRVHHGCDPKYLDKNYAGILIIWDRLFGTFQEEQETPRYGLARDFDSVNPMQVWFSEFPKFFKDLAAAKSFRELLLRLFGPPNWQPK